MKQMLARFAQVFVVALLVTVVATPIAEAKKFGGGKSFGKSFKTAPAPKQTQQNTSNLKKDSAATSSKRGIMGGLLGGLLAGGLLAAFFGGAFEGIQFLDIVVIGLLVFVGFRLFRHLTASSIDRAQRQGYMDRHAYTSAEYDHATRSFDTKQAKTYDFSGTSAKGGFGSNRQADVPFNFAADFDQAAFIDGAREHYRIIQGAWNHNELQTISEYVSEALYQDLKEERARLAEEQFTDVMYVDAEIVRADFDDRRAQLSLQFRGRYRDTATSVEEEITDIWHLERDMRVENAPWLIIGIQA